MGQIKFRNQGSSEFSLLHLKIFDIKQLKIILTHLVAYYIESMLKLVFISLRINLCLVDTRDVWLLRILGNID